MIKLIIIFASLVYFAVSNDSLPRSLKPGKRLIPPSFKYPNFTKVQNQGGRIVDGDDAPPGQYPYQAIVIIDDTWFCGGSVISECNILTAAHCVDGFQTAPKKILIIVGRHTLSQPSDNEQVFRADKVDVHEAYNSKYYPHDSRRKSREFDIC